jgi:filamentous hemagglutinin family protein
MNVRNLNGKVKRHKQAGLQGLKLAPIASAIAVVMATSGIMSPAHAQQVFSRAWYGKQQQHMEQMRATGVLPNGQPIRPPQQQQSREQLERSWGNVNRAAQALAATLNAQQIARNNGGNIPVITVTDGVGGNGLVVDLSKAWQNATLKNPVTENGQTKVTIEQDAARAIAYWDSFNVGKNTHVHFDQQGNSDWVILNKVSNSVAPSQIQGKVTADGTVLIVNNNGVVFTGTSQINVRNLVAAAANMSDAQFNDSSKGLYSTQAGAIWQPTFTGANGMVEVQEGALIQTKIPTTGTQGGGYVLLAGKSVINAGEIQTAKGQTTLAAGDSFIIRKGVGTDANQYSTTRGNEVVTSGEGTVVNKGVIIAKEGDITLAGHDIRQDGVLVATTTVNTRGTIHLLNSKNDATGQIAFGEEAVTAILIEDDGKTTALDSQRDKLIEDSAKYDQLRSAAVQDATFDNLSQLSDRRDQSRIEIVTGGKVVFEGSSEDAPGSLTMATGGQIVVDAKQRAFVAKGAELDVSGLVGVSVAMESNNVLINVQGNELRDAALNRDGGGLINKDIWVDVRDLIYVPAGTGGYDSERWYLPGGLLEVGGYVSNMGHRIGEWAAQGGTITLNSNEVITQAGSTINLSGGTLDVATGYVENTWLRGVDGKRYNAKNAPVDMQYTGLYLGFQTVHEKTGTTKSYYNPLITPKKHLENGYTVGRDAGKLIVSAPTAVLEGKIDAQVFNSDQQVKAPTAVADGYKQVQTAVARAGQLYIGNTITAGLPDALQTKIRVGDVDQITEGMLSTDVLDVARTGTVQLDAATLNEMGLGKLALTSKDSIVIERDVTLADGGAFSFVGPDVDIAANLTARGGSFSATNLMSAGNGATRQLTKNGTANFTVRDGAAITLGGVWMEQSDIVANPSGLAFIKGGDANITYSHNITLEDGSRIDVTSGAAKLASGKIQTAKGGNVTLHADSSEAAFNNGGKLVLDGDIAGYGTNGGGKLSVTSGDHIVIGGNSPVANTLALSADMFTSGFSAYDINGMGGVTVADNAVVDVLMPVYRIADVMDSNAALRDQFTVWTPELYLNDEVKRTLTQRAGASLTLKAVRQSNNGNISPDNNAAVTVGKGAVVSVDPGASIKLIATGQIAVDGTLNAWGGNITLDDARNKAAAFDATANNRAIWIGDNALLDAAGRSKVVHDANGRAYGIVQSGGTINIGSALDWEGSKVLEMRQPDMHVVVRPGAVLDASGSSAVLDLPAANGGYQSTVVSGHGGTIVLASANSLYLDGTMKAAAGGAGAAGGTLGLALGSAYYQSNQVNNNSAVMAPRVIKLSQIQGGSLLGSDAQLGDTLTYGTGYIGVDRIENGGFGNLSVFGTLVTDEDITLSMNQSLRLWSGAPSVLATATGNKTVSLSAPHVQIGSQRYKPWEGGDYFSGAPDNYSKDAFSNAHTLRVTADLIDLRDVVDLRFDDVSMYSRGDIRLLRGVEYPGVGELTRITAPTLVTLTASQLYPMTGGGGIVRVGNDNSGLFITDGILRIESNGTVNPAKPLSAFGSLSLQAGSIEQKGIVRAPFGNITFGLDFGSDTQQVRFFPGSETSVSGAGLIVPYGGTVDGIKYNYNGKEIEIGSAFDTTVLKRGIKIYTTAMGVDEGAVLDMSGGGELIGAGFVAGRGGSVDVLKTALINVNPAYSFSNSSNQIYAIVPGYVGDYAPVGLETGAGVPAIGKQITIRDGVPGLPAGVYTLLPSQYALMPGAFRVEIGKQTTGALSGNPAATAGSYMGLGYLGTANTTIQSTLANTIILTPADVVRQYSGYNETGYNKFVQTDAARKNALRGTITDDAYNFNIVFDQGAGTGNVPALRFDGTALFAPAANSQGFGGTLTVGVGYNTSIELLTQDQGAITTTGSRVLLQADALNAFTASRLNIAATGGLIVRTGVTLQAPEVILSAGGSENALVVEQGATISTLGMGKPSFSSLDGYFYEPTGASLVVSNGWINMTPSTGLNGSPKIDLGACLASCTGEARILSEGTIGVVTNGAFTLADNLVYGTKNLTLAVSAINLGSAEVLEQVAANGNLPTGMMLNKDVLDNLLRGNTALGTPALETLTLNARDAVNVFGSVELDTTNPLTGKSAMERLVFGAPAIYGYGAAGDSATIRTGEFVWAGTVAEVSRTNSSVGNDAGQAPGAAMPDLLGAGTLNVIADTIRFDYAPDSRPVTLVSSDRYALGFSSVNLTANKAVIASGKGSLHVYEDQNQYVAGKGWQYSGGDLNITAPVVMGGSGASLDIYAGRAMTIKGNGAEAGTTNALGASLKLVADTINLDTAVVLPSGKLTLEATGDITLGDAAKIDLAGREIAMFDVKRYSWGGDLVLSSKEGDITTTAASSIDVSAQHNAGGTITVTALGNNGGHVDLAGSVKAGASGVYNASGVYVPYDSGYLTLRAQTLADFAGLNARLNDGDLFGARRFQIKQGDIVIGDEVKARHVQVVADGGSLTVNGKIDASGFQVGSIRLAARDNLTINGQLDAHATGLRRDSYGKIIDAPNRAIVELTSKAGEIVLANNAVIDVRAGTESVHNDGKSRGTVDIHAPRVGTDDIAVDVRGTIDIRGAKQVAVYGFRTYDDAPLAALPDVTGERPQLITQSYLDTIHGHSQTFMTGALSNADLSSRLAGLGQYKVRPSVEIVSNAATNPGGVLTVAGDIDMSNYRYGPDANTTNEARRGYGEPGKLVLRAAGDLNIYGSINDGFAPPPESLDDNGWILSETSDPLNSGMNPYGTDIIVPIDHLRLEAGTTFPEKSRLNYDIPVKAVTLPAGTTVPVQVTLTGNYALTAGMVLPADVTRADGSVLKAGTVIASGGLVLGANDKLGAGFLLRADTAVGAMIWPKGAQLPAKLVVSEQITLARGSLIPSMTKVELAGDQPVNLRPVEADGRQGRNWALASMLPEGTTSWSMSLVAGADLDSADMRARNLNGTGSLNLSDAHYGVTSKIDKRTEQAPVTGPWVFTKEGALSWFEDESAAGLTQEELDKWMMAQFGMGWDDVFPGQTLEGLCKNTGAGECKQIATGPLVLTAEGAADYIGFAELAGMTYEEADVWLKANQGGLGWADFLGEVTLAEVCAWGAGVCTNRAEQTGPLILTATGAADYIGFAELAGMTYEEADVWLKANQGGLGWKDFLGDVAMADVCGWGEGICTNKGAEPPKEIVEYTYATATPAFSVVRTGTGDLELLAAQDVRMMSLYGVYTAGTQTSLTGVDNSQFQLPRGTDKAPVLGEIQKDGKYDAALAAWQAWYPDHGGNLLVSAGRDIIGDSLGNNAGNGNRGESWEVVRSTYATSAVSNWLWRQGSGSTQGVDPIATSWWINFGTYTKPENGTPRMTGFTGFGTLGGGNVDIDAGRHAGIVEARGEAQSGTLTNVERSQGLVVAVGSTGRVVDGDMVLTGGGDLTIRIGGSLNPNAKASLMKPSAGILATQDNLDTNGVFTNLRGALHLDTNSIGGMTPAYGVDGGGIRTNNPFALASATTIAGPVLMLGDASAWVNTQADMVLSGVGDPGRVAARELSVYTANGETLTGANSWFSLWTGNTAVNLFSAGGNVRPIDIGAGKNIGSNLSVERTSAIYNQNVIDSVFYPSLLSVVAPGGNILMGMKTVNAQGVGYEHSVLHLAPSVNGSLELLAGGSIRANADAQGIVMSGADTALPSPLNPAFAVWKDAQPVIGNISSDGYSASRESNTLFAFGPDTATGSLLHKNDNNTARFYAVEGDIIGLNVGLTRTLTDMLYNRTRTVPYWFSAATAVQMRAGTDILDVDVVAANNHETDISVIQAGRDIVFANAVIAGPGSLDIVAGRQLRQDDIASVTSVGSLLASDARAGASIVMAAGMTDANWAALRTLYLDPANRADTTSGVPLAEQTGKVARTYEEELAHWLKARFKQEGNLTQNLAYFDALAPEQQQIFLREVYFAELREGGREYNDANGPRYGSYLRGRQMIATLFPDVDANGNTIARVGDITMFGGSGVHTDFGGNIAMMAPGGQIVVGIQGEVPPASAGVMTQGNGNISMFSEQSLLLGLSRIMTTYGGSIFAWSEEGDINAGRGAKTTTLFTPPKLTYDAFGNIKLAPQVPSSGAGIATLAPIPEVPGGDMDLIAPLGTIDAGEAGIRFSGDLNIAANVILNAENIKGQGKTSGLPILAAVNIGALTAASAAGDAAAAGAQEALQRDRANARNNLPSVFTVRVLGFGNEPAARAEEASLPTQSQLQRAYDKDGAVQVLHSKALDPAMVSMLTVEERQALQQQR